MGITDSGIDLKRLKEIREERRKIVQNYSDEELEYNILENDDVDCYQERFRRMDPKIKNLLFPKLSVRGK